MKLELEYFYQKDVQSLTFYKLPKVLFSDSRLKPLTNEAKILYTIMLDRVSLSIANGWLDDIGRVFIYYTVKESCDMLNKSDRHLSKILAELDDVKGLGLIERKKQGLGRPDVIYVKNLASLPEEIQEQGSESQEENQNKKSKKSGDFKAKPPICQEKLSTIPEKLPVDNFSDTQSIPLLNGNPCVSRHENYSGQEPNSFPPNNTNITNTEQTKTDLFRPTLPPSPQPTFPQFPQQDDLMEGWRELSREQKIEQVRQELDLALCRGKEHLIDLFYDYKSNRDKLETALYHLSEMEQTERFAEQHEEYSKPKLMYHTKKLYLRALLEMILEPKFTSVRGAAVTYSKLIESLVPHIVYDYDTIFDNIVSCTLMAYTQANEYSEIKFPLPYMKSCIWSTLCEGGIRSEAQFHHDFQ